MSKLFIVLLLTIASQSLADSVTDGTKLISTFLVHRHGDRTPTTGTGSYCTDVDACNDMINQYGDGQLTNQGKRRAYQLGKDIRNRYDELLSPQYNKSEVYIRSTEYTRARMTILSALAALYPAYPGSWSDEINWVPVPYTNVPAKYDWALFSSTCPNFINSFDAAMLSKPDIMAKHYDTINALASLTGYNLTQTPVQISIIYDVYYSQVNMGIPLPAEIEALMPQLRDAASDAFAASYGKEDTLSLAAGVFLDEFFTQSDNLISGTDTPPVRIYSTHDVNVFAVESAALATPKQGVPQYAAFFGLELRQVEETDQYVVLPVYLPTPGSDVIYLTTEGCDQLCDYETFRTLVSKNTLDDATWRTKCDFSADNEVEVE